jgi:hypothetical protein
LKLAAPMMQTLKYFLPILCLVLLLQNCRRGCYNDETVTEYKIDEGELKKIPYKGFESLTFVRTTTGDTHTFVGDGWKTYWGLYDAGLDCPNPERYEKRQLVFSSTTFSKPITISIYVHHVNHGLLLQVDFQNEVFEEGSADVGKPYDLDSLTVLGTDYYGIEFLSDVNSATPVTYKCYYNVENGIIRLFFENGETWDLLKP